MEKEEGFIGPPRPKAQPEQQACAEEAAAAAEAAFIGPPRPKPSPGPQRPPVRYDSDDDYSDSDEDSDEGSSSKKAQPQQPRSIESFGFPITHEASLSGHTKLVSALALDPAGARLLTGSHDYMVKFWDFAGMDRSLRSFREIEPYSGYPINHLSYSPTGDQFAVAPDGPKAKIYTRDGFQVIEFVKGDQYLSDMTNTKGHVAPITGLMWHPTDKNLILTSSSDSTVRIWDVNTCDKKQKTVIKAKSARGTKTSITASAYNPDATLIGAACADGSIQIWKESGPYIRPHIHINDAHPDGSDTSCIRFSGDGYSFISRSSDDTLKVWDLRQTSQPAAVFGDLLNFIPQTDCIFSPDDKFIVTGTNVKKNQGSGLLVFIEKKTMQKVAQIGVSEGSVVRLLWHPKINQIIVGSADTKAHIFYDPEKSKQGALLCVTRQRRKIDPSDLVIQPVIITPHALPMFREEKSAKKQREKARKDPKLSRRPETAVTAGPGYGGRVGESMTHILMKDLGVTKKTFRDEDPREAILKYAKVAEEKPYFIAPAYKATQPVTPFDMSEQEEAEKERAERERYEKLMGKRRRFDNK